MCARFVGFVVRVFLWWLGVVVGVGDGFLFFGVGG